MIKKINKELTIDLKKELKIIEKDNPSIKYHYIYSYELEIDNSIHPTLNSLSLYVGEGTISRLVYFNRPFMKTKAYEKLKENIKKKLLYILENPTEQQIKNTEAFFIKSYKPIFNQTNSDLNSNIKSLANEKTKLLIKNNHIVGVHSNYRGLANTEIKKSNLHKLDNSNHISKKGYEIKKINNCQNIDKIIAEMFILKNCWSKIFEKYDLIPTDFL